MRHPFARDEIKIGNATGAETNGHGHLVLKERQWTRGGLPHWGAGRGESPDSSPGQVRKELSVTDLPISKKSRTTRFWCEISRFLRFVLHLKPTDKGCGLSRPV